MSQIYKCHKSPDLVANSFDASTGVVEATGILSLRQAWAIQRVFLKQTNNNKVYRTSLRSDVSLAQTL